MAFGDFAFPQVPQDPGLIVDEADLFSAAPEWPVREEFAATIAEDARLG